MAKEVLGKVVRVNYTEVNPKGSKLEVYQEGRKKFIRWFDGEAGVLGGGTIYRYDEKGDKLTSALSDDECIQAVLKFVARGISSDGGKTFTPGKLYKVIQDPYTEDPVVNNDGSNRIYGSTPYYLTNGAYIKILWYDKMKEGEFVTSNEDNADKLFFTQSDTNTLSRRVDFKEVYMFPPSGTTLEGGNTHYVLARNREKGEYFEYKEVLDKQSIGSTGGTGSTSNSDEENIRKAFYWDYDSDWELLDFSLKLIKNSVFSNDIDPDVKKMIEDIRFGTCLPSYESCNVIPFHDILKKGKPKTTEQSAEQETKDLATASVGDGRLSIFSEEEQINVQTNTNFNITLRVGANSEEISVSNGEELDPEYTEELLEIEKQYLEVLPVDVIIQQRQVAEEQQDSIKLEGTVQEPVQKVDIKLVQSHNDILVLAGSYARKTGKNGKVNSENMKKGYTPGIHGLCPQGTLATLSALTGNVAIGKLRGHADWFSFKSPGTDGGTQNLAGVFEGVQVYNPKVRLQQINGSWKGTYFKDPSQWQVGDLVAMGYTPAFNSGRYGHIQIWTGYSWQSDFRQNNNIQINGVDPSTVALWRMTQAGLDLVKKQSANPKS